MDYLESKTTKISSKEIKVFYNIVNRIKLILNKNGYKEDIYTKRFSEKIQELYSKIPKEYLENKENSYEIEIPVKEAYNLYRLAHLIIKNLKNKNIKIDRESDLYIQSLYIKSEMIFSDIYRWIAMDIAKPVIDDINKKFGVSYDIEILLGMNEIENKLGKVPDFYDNEAVTTYENNGKLYILIGRDYNYLSSSYTYSEENEKIQSENLDDYLNKEVPLQYTIVHEYLHRVLMKKLPKTHSISMGLEKILNNIEISFPYWETWTETFAYLFWRKNYGTKIPKSIVNLDKIPFIYLVDIYTEVEEIKAYSNNIRDVYEYINKIKRIKERLEKEGLHEIEENGIIIKDIKDADNLIEIKKAYIEEYKNKIRKEKKWISYDLAYILGDIMGKI